MRQIGRWDHKLQKVVWHDRLPPAESKGPYVIDDSMDAVEMVGLPPQYETRPDGSVHKMRDVMVNSKSQRRRLLRQHNMIEMGNDAPSIVTKVREKRQHERETRG